MTGREKILQAFEPSGTPEIGVVTCYDSIFIRDHWFALTDVPWWYAQSGVVEKELAWAGDVCRKTGLEWFTVSPCPSRVERSRHQYDQREDGVWLANGVTGRRRRLSEPMPSGTNTSCASSIHGDLDSLPATEDEVNALIPLSESFDRGRFLDEGRHDVAVALRDSLDVLIYGHISSPLWSLYSILGYEGMMVFLLQDRGLSSYAAERILQNTVQRIRMFSTLGADAIWIEECLTDQISPEIFVALNVPILRECVKEIRGCGLKSIYYYCGNPHDRFDAILDVGADALHLEEGKKGFTVDIADIVRLARGRCVVFGNLDAINVLPNADEKVLRSEIERQLAVGRANGGRFVMSTGSPITPGTSVERVRLYTDFVREFGSR